MTNTPFDPTAYLGAALLSQITDLRVAEPDALREHARQRPRRETLAPRGRLLIVAADHPGRLVTGALGDDLAMADRRSYLARVLRVVTSDFVDGLMGTPDLLEEVLAADLLSVRAGRPSFLAGKLLVGCMNRGGLAGTCFELRDTFTAYDAAGLVAMNLDGGKLMFRLDPEDPASGETITGCAAAVNALLDHDLPAFVEPLLVRREGGKLSVLKDPASLARVAGVAAALGRSSLNTWLKLPYGPGYDRVAAATTCPILMLGGEAAADPRPLLTDLAVGLRSGANVRGALIGRNVLYPGHRDPLALAAAINALVCNDLETDPALAYGERQAGLSPADFARQTSR